MMMAAMGNLMAAMGNLPNLNGRIREIRCKILVLKGSPNDKTGISQIAILLEAVIERFILIAPNVRSGHNSAWAWAGNGWPGMMY